MSALGQKQNLRHKTMSNFTPVSRHLQCNGPCLLFANSGHSVTAELTMKREITAPVLAAMYR